MRRRGEEPHKRACGLNKVIVKGEAHSVGHVMLDPDIACELFLNDCVADLCVPEVARATFNSPVKGQKH